MEQLRVRLISLFILCCFATITYSQSFKGGLIGGFTTSQVDGDEHSGFHRIGAYGGVFVTRDKDNSPWEHIFELAFAQKGAASANHSFKTTIGYVDVNYILQAYPHFWLFSFPEKVSIGIGPTMSVKAYENILLNNLKSTCNDFNKIDFQLTTNLKYRMFLGDKNKQITDIETRLSYSVIPNNNRYYNFTLYFLLRYYLSH